MINSSNYFQDNTFSRELKLLCLCSQKNITETDTEQILLLSKEDIDWKRFVLLAKKHRVYPIVYKNITNTTDFYRNEQVFSVLKTLNTKNAIHTLKLAKELVRVSSEFNRQEIPAISLKGPVLAICLYRNISSRVSRDLDILIDVKDVDKAIKVLLDLGYSQDDFLAVATEKQKKYCIRKEHHFCFKSEEGILLELHWRFESEDFKFDFERLWNNKISFDIFGVTVFVLNHEENFLYLVFHGSKHAWKRLRWLNDIAELIKENTLNWSTVWEEANKREIDYMVAQALMLCNVLFQTKLPTDFLLQKTAFQLAEKLSKLCIPFFESINENEENFGLDLQYHGLYRQLWKKYKHQQFSWNIFPTSMEFKKYNIPDRFFFFYYPIRQYCLLKKYVLRKKK